MPAGRLGGRRLLHLQPAGPRAGGRHAGRRGVPRVLRRAGHGAGHVGRGHPRRCRDHAGRNAHRAARQPGHRAGQDRDALQRVLRRARSARPAAVLRQRRPPACVPGSAHRGRRNGWRPPRLRWGSPRSEPSSGGRCPGQPEPICWCSGPMAWWTRGTTPGEPFGEQRLLDEVCAHRKEAPEAIVKRGAGTRPRASAPARPTTARCWSCGSSVPRAKRRLGQHFLTDPRMLARIADALEAGPADTVLEIGPGPGGLTARAPRASGAGDRHREGSRADPAAAGAISPVWS